MHNWSLHKRGRIAKCLLPFQGTEPRSLRQHAVSVNALQQTYTAKGSVRGSMSVSTDLATDDAKDEQPLGWASSPRTRTQDHLFARDRCLRGANHNGLKVVQQPKESEAELKRGLEAIAVNPPPAQHGWRRAGTPETHACLLRWVRRM